MRHHVYLIPGMFGFGRLAGVDYFEHVEAGLSRRFELASTPVHLEVIQAPPTASFRRRASVVAREVARTANDVDGPIHLIGHSTGGLDARLLLSPGANLHLPHSALQWLPRVRSLVTVNTPHYGTPLAAYFTTVAGTRMLYALSLLTVTSLSIGRLPLTAFSSLVAGVAAVDDKLGLDIHLLDQLTEQLLAVIGERGQGEVHRYLEDVRDDRGGIIQLMPEVMDMFNAAVRDSDSVRYACVASAAPPPGPRRLLSAVTSPYQALQLAVYSTVYGVASRADPRYPYSAVDAELRSQLRHRIGRVPTSETVDGIVPTLSMLWRELIWCGEADHLDVVGHFEDNGLPRQHVDWLGSGAGFNRRQFGDMLDAIARFQLRQ